MATARAGGKGATIYSVADLAGVSIATVSRVLQGSTVVAEGTRAKVLAAVEDLDYVPLGAARSLAVRRHEAHGLVLPELSGPYYSELLMGFESRAAELGQSVTVLLGRGKRDLTRAVGRLATRVDGMAFLGSTALTVGVNRLHHGRGPVVIIAGPSEDGIEAISAENIESAQSLTKHLLHHGRSQLLFVGDPDTAPDIAERYEGFKRAHRGRKGTRAAQPVLLGLREADGTRFADRLLAGDHEADALVCANDEVALAIMSRLQDEGRRIPEEIAVVGWDDVMTARYMRPALTTVRQPVHELGALAASRLHELCNGAESRLERTILPTEVVLRASCGCTPVTTPGGTRPPTDQGVTRT